MKAMCNVCGKNISKERLKALEMLDLPMNQWACVQCSQVKKKSGIYMGEYGTSELRIVDEVRDDSVRAVFGSEETVKSEVED
jgi:hypothetical protein